MPKQGKVWGETEEIYNNGTISINVLEIKKGGFSSEHQHGRKVNMFHVISGRLEIDQWPGVSEGEKPDMTVLEAGQQTLIPIGAWHGFKALEDTLCLEIYAVRLIGEDIARRTHGGMEN
jgi:quercetin dioxygenase-like cupin family protein